MFTAFKNSDLQAIADAIRPTPAGGNLIQASTASITTTAETDLFPQPGANYYNYLNFALVTNSDPAVGTWVNIKDETGNVLATGWAAPNSGFILPLGSTPVRTETTNKKITVTCETATAGVRVSAVGYKVINNV